MYTSTDVMSSDEMLLRMLNEPDNAKMILSHDRAGKGPHWHLLADVIEETRGSYASTCELGGVILLTQPLIVSLDLLYKAEMTCDVFPLQVAQFYRDEFRKVSAKLRVLFEEMCAVIRKDVRRSQPGVLHVLESARAITLKWLSTVESFVLDDKYKATRGPDTRLRKQSMEHWCTFTSCF